MATRPTLPRLQKQHGKKVWTSYWRDDAGKLHCKRFGGDKEVTKRMAEARYNAWLTERWTASEQIRNPQDRKALYSASDLARDYTAHAEQTYRKNGKVTTHVDEIRTAMKLMADAWGTRPMVSIEGHELARLRDAMVAGTKVEVLSERTVNGKLAAIKAAVVWASMEKGLLPEAKAVAFNLVGPLRGGRKGRKTEAVKPVPREVVEATLPYLPSVVQDMVKLQSLTGMRSGEVCGLTWAQITKEKDVWLYHPAGHKTEHLDKDRVVVLGPKAQEVLKKYEGAASHIFNPQAAFVELVTRRRGKAPKSMKAIAAMYDKDSYRKAIARATEEAFGMSKEIRWQHKDTPAERKEKEAARKAWREKHLWHPHQLRHLRATEIRAASGIQAAAASLGHDSTETTLLYAARNLELAREVAMQMG